MLPAGVSESAYKDLLISESEVMSGQRQITRRAEIYLATGALTLDRVLDALKISRATWYRRREALRTSEAADKAASPRKTPEALSETDPPCNF